MRADHAYQVGAACAVIALASLYDAWATWVAIRLGFQEANPIFAELLNAPGGEAAIAHVVGLKAIGIIALAYGSWRAISRGHRPAAILTVLRAIAYAHLLLALYHSYWLAHTIQLASRT